MLCFVLFVLNPDVDREGVAQQPSTSWNEEIHGKGASQVPSSAALAAAIANNRHNQVISKA